MNRKCDERMHKNLSEVLIEIAEVALAENEPEADAVARQVALLLASIAWNREVGGEHWQPPTAYEAILRNFANENPEFWRSLVASNEEEVIQILRTYKRKHYRGDKRLIKQYSVNPMGRIEVQWQEPA